MPTVNDKSDTTPTIESSALQAKHLEMLKQAAETGTKIKVTENSNPLLVLTVTKPKTQTPKKPFLDADRHQQPPSKDGKPVFGRDRHLVVSYGDLISPINEDRKEYG